MKTIYVTLEFPDMHDDADPEELAEIIRGNINSDEDGYMCGIAAFGEY